MDFQSLFNAIATVLVNWATNVGIKLLIALAIMLVTFRIINFIGRRIEKAAEKHHADKTIMHTVAYIFRIAMKLVVTVCLISYIGINTSAFTALIASLGVCVGLAVNGALANLAGGVLIILTRPFRIDDFIEAQGHSGFVEDIRITNTKLRTFDNKIVYIPNGALSAGSIVNYSQKDTRRVDEIFSISHAEDFKRVRDILSEIADSHPLTLKDPAPFIRISEHTASATKISERVWVKNEDYWTVKFDILESVKERFDAEGIEIPFEQMDVHIKND
jgi:small conductance mechanosensitive channel